MKLKLSNLVIPQWVRIVWRLGPFVVIAGLGLTVHEKNWAIHDLKQTAQTEKAQDDAASANQQLVWAVSKSDAIESLASKFAARQPILKAGNETVSLYAKTPDGSSACLDAVRMRGIADTHTALEAATASSREKRREVPVGDSGKGPE
jgi:hypothetical protein